MIIEWQVHSESAINLNSWTQIHNPSEGCYLRGREPYSLTFEATSTDLNIND